MKALTLNRYQKKGLDGVALQELPQPQPLSHQVLVRMKAAAFNPADLHIASGEMKMMSPAKPPFAMGVDGAGVVEKLGSAVRGVAVGDEVFFYTGLVHGGTVAEYAVVDAQALGRKPHAWTFEQAASWALALLCANLSLTRARVKAGQRVLVHGGGGAVGSAAIVLARALGAQVDTTANGTDALYLRGLGAQNVLDYKSQPLTGLPQAAYDMVLDGMGGEVFFAILAPRQIRRGVGITQGDDRPGRHVAHGHETTGHRQMAAAADVWQVHPRSPKSRHSCGRRCNLQRWHHADHIG